jgi:peptide subunit release factor RF-3
MRTCCAWQDSGKTTLTEKLLLYGGACLVDLGPDLPNS